uniref:T-complex protein 11-like protein 2-like n=1 Tax=Scleropages formosus TaxID=113540 RepID=A0A8C9R5R3_SCLFO
MSLGNVSPQPTLLDMLEAERCMTNLTLAHEIVVNKDFRLKQNNPAQDSLEGRVKEVAHRAFWDTLRAQLSLNPPDYTHAISLLQEVKDNMLSLLLPAHTRLRAELEEALDMALIRQQAEHSALDLHRLGSYVVSTMASLCAPARDPEIHKLRNLSDPVDLLREILRVLGLMKMDMVNFTVQSLRPHLLQQAIQYERAKFQAILEKLPTSLDYTSTWLQGAVQELSALRVQSDANTQNSGQAVPPPGGSCPHKIAPVSPCAALNLAYLHLLSWEPSGECYPETVQMDRLRIELLGQTLKCLVLEAAVLLVTSTQCGGALFSAVGFVDTLKQTVATLLKGCHESAFDLKGALLGLGEQVQKIVNSTLIAQGGGALPPEQESLLKGQVAALAEEHNPVRALVGARVRSYLQALLGQSVAQRATPVPPALALMENELAELGTAFVRIVNFNRQVFGPYYSAILKKLIPNHHKLAESTIQSDTVKALSAITFV